LPGRHLGKKVIHTEGSRVGHAATKTTRAKSASFAGKSHDSAVPTVFAADAKKSMNRNAAAQVSLELVKHEGRQFAASSFQIRQKRRPVLLYGLIEQSRFGTMALIRARGPVGVTACCWLRGEHRQEFSATRPDLLLAKRSLRPSQPSRACGQGRPVRGCEVHGLGRLAACTSITHR
jgi:hypothetical protein